LCCQRTWLAFGSRVVDGYVQATESRYGLIDQPANVLFMTHIGVHKFRFGTQPAKFGD
jgi:hypothetical protein